MSFKVPPYKISSEPVKRFGYNSEKYIQIDFHVYNISILAERRGVATPPSSYQRWNFATNHYMIKCIDYDSKKDIQANIHFYKYRSIPSPPFVRFFVVYCKTSSSVYLFMWLNIFHVIYICTFLVTCRGVTEYRHRHRSLYVSMCVDTCACASVIQSFSKVSLA